MSMDGFSYSIHNRIELRNNLLYYTSKSNISIDLILLTKNKRKGKKEKNKLFHLNNFCMKKPEL